MDLESFLTILVFVFALVMIIAGVFTAYFGAGKSRKVGVGLLVVGLAVLLVWLALVGAFGDLGLTLFSGFDAWDAIVEALLTIIAAVIGAAGAVGIFLVAVMKS